MLFLMSSISNIIRQTEMTDCKINSECKNGSASSSTSSNTLFKHIGVSSSFVNIPCVQCGFK